VKQHLAVLSSVVASSANESFSAMSYDTSPNGAQLIGSRSYPNPNNVYAHWWLGGPSEALAAKDQTGNNRDLTKVGSPNLSDTFKSGKYSGSNWTTSNYFKTADSTGTNYDGNGELVQTSFWFYYDTTNGATRVLFAAYYNAGVSNGWNPYIFAGAATFKIDYFTGSGTNTLTHPATLANGTWNHLVCQTQSGVVSACYLNGVYASISASTIAAIAANQALYVGARADSLGSGLAIPTLGMKLADMIVWRGGALLTQADVNYLYNAGVPQWIGYNPAVLRNEYAVTGQSGQRISMKAKLNRTTSAVSPYILNAGMIKTGREL
jgi:hypothetical protein